MEKKIIFNELEFKAVRSSGPGGQNVNKVSSKIELSFNISSSQGLTEDEKSLLLNHLSARISKNNILILSCQESRSQHRNKELIIKRFFNLLTKNSIPKKSRKVTVPSKSEKLKRLLNKKRLSEKKENRKKIQY